MPVHSPGDPSWAPRLWTALFAAFVFATGSAIAIVLYRGGNKKVLLIAAASAVLLAGLERLEIKYGAGFNPRWDPFSGHSRLLLAITAVTLVVYFPIRNVYFLADDIPFVHVFHRPSLAAFLRLFSTDVSQNVWSVSFEELRPLYGLSYMLGYLLSGTNPLGYHLIALVQHILCSWMVYLIAKHAAGCDSWSAGFAGLLFAVLPIHSQTIPWISGAFTEISPAFFYLAAFLCFVLYRTEGRARYLVLSAAAFAACLLSKEVTATLPLMLLSYEVFRRGTGENGRWQESQTIGKRWLAFGLPYLPFAALLVLYLGLRRMAFSSYLREDTWGARIPETLSSIPAFLSWLGGAWIQFRNLQEFNLRESMFPFPGVPLGVVLGLCLVWAVFLFRDRFTDLRPMASILYFGLVWYLISGVPLLFHPYLVIRRLYLPAAGPCIAMAALAMPSFRTHRKRILYSRCAGALFLVILSAVQLGRLNRQWVHAGKVSEKLEIQLGAALEQIPNGSLVVVTAPWALPPDSLETWNFRQTERAFVWGWVLPYALQEPFTSANLYSRVRIIEENILYCCLLGEWLQKARQALISAWQGAPEEKIELHRLAWDYQTESVQWKRRWIAKGAFRAYVEKTLGKPLEAVEPVDDDAVHRLTVALVELFSENR